MKKLNRLFKIGKKLVFNIAQQRLRIYAVNKALPPQEATLPPLLSLASFNKDPSNFQLANISNYQLLSINSLPPKHLYTFTHHVCRIQESC